MRVDLYEKIWMGVAAALIVIFLAAIVVAAGAYAIHPQSHVETIDPTTVLEDPEFGNPGVAIQPDGSVVVTLVAEMFFFDPDPIEVPAGRPVTFRLTSPDVIHGFEIVGTNANTMVIPGYVSEFTMSFAEPGEHLVVCNEYCGLLHHNMVGKLIVQEVGE
ncbi:MAG TPA: cytochrome c oxidase subunit II [Vicinamibacteria bacterium]|nr:cytochrome c oxidase subunit II [Vicinamibacteria bacterium]